MLLLGSYLVGSSEAFASNQPLTSEIIARSQLSAGDLARLSKVLARARRGEPITLGFIGGSITAGAFATGAQNAYAGRVAAWWRDRFPRCNLRMINAGVGGTGSMYGALRAGRDLLSGSPDLVVIEFAVNDNWTDGEAFEGLVRQILAQPNQPAVLLLFMMWEKGGNDQAMQAKVGAHYHLPMVSFRDAIWPEIEAGRLNWSDYIADKVHPTDAGHAAAALFVTTMCETALNAASADRSITAKLPPPLHSDRFAHVDWRDAAALDPFENRGWRLDFDEKNIPAWVSGGTQGRIAFEWSGSGVVVVFAEPPRDLRDIEFRIDGASSFQALDVLGQPRRRLFVLSQNLRPGHHTVELACNSNDDPGRRAEQIRVLGIAGIGINSDLQQL